jgi:hypothetical protein
MSKDARQRVGNHPLLAQDGGTRDEQLPFLALLYRDAAAEPAASDILDE